MDNQVISIDNGLVYFGGNKEMYKRALIRFSTSYNDMPDKLVELFDKNREEIKTKTHNIKSSAKMIGAESLYIIANRYDKLIRTEIENFTMENVNEIAQELNRVFACIEQKLEFI